MGWRRVGRTVTMRRGVRVLADGLVTAAPSLTASGGTYGTELDELELGWRAATVLDQENNCWGADGMLFWHLVDTRRDQFVKKKQDRNPIRKMHPGRQKVLLFSGGTTVHVVGDPWMATCFECGEVLRRFKSRKTAKDGLYRHRKEAHG